MFCTQCGTKIPDDSRFCQDCGAPVSGRIGGSASADQSSTTPKVDGSLEERANTLVGAAHVLAISSYGQFAKDLPLIDRLPQKNWDFFLTIAGVFIAASALQRLRIGNMEDTVMDIVARNLDDWNRDGLNAFEDCKRMFEKTFDQLASSSTYRNDRRFLTADSVGLWVAWNLLGHQPVTDEDHRLVRLTGVAVTRSFASWWKH